MFDYSLGKLAAANYQIAIHPEAANIRLTSQADRILIVSPEVVPQEFREDFLKLQELISKNYGQRHPYRLQGIYNKTAAKYIKLLLDIQFALELQKSDN